jgi:hypothetical protein
MLRRLLIDACVLLAALLVVVWVASYWLQVSFQIGPRDQRGFSVDGAAWSGRCEVAFLTTAEVVSGVPQTLPAPSGRAYSWGPFDGITSAQLWSTDPTTEVPTPIKRRYNSLAMPIWFPILALLILPFAAFLLGPVRRWSRRRHGRCLRCGYSLRGLPEARCPECGTRADVVSQSEVVAATVDRGRRSEP